MTSWRPYWCSKTMTRGHVGIPNHLFVPKHFFVPKHLQRCWSREWKRSTLIHVGSPQTSLLDNQFPATLFLPSSEALGTT